MSASITPSSPQEPASPAIEALDPSIADFGTKLKHLRKTLHLSAEGLANALGVTGPTIFRWEAKHDIPESKLRRLKTVLHEIAAHDSHGESMSESLSNSVSGRPHPVFWTLAELLEEQAGASRVFLIKAGIPFLSGGSSEVGAQMIENLKKNVSLEYHFFFASDRDSETVTRRDAKRAAREARTFLSQRPARDSFAKFKRKLPEEVFNRVHGWRIPLPEESILLQRVFLFSPVIVQKNDDATEMFYELPLLFSSNSSQSEASHLEFEWKWTCYPPRLFPELWDTQLSPTIEAIIRNPTANEFLASREELSDWPVNIIVNYPEGLGITH